MWIDEVHLTLEDTFVKTHAIDVRHKPVWLRCVMMAKEIEFEIEKNSYVRRNQVEFGLNGKMKNEQIVVVSRETLTNSWGG